jgi:hypothetical protein
MLEYSDLTVYKNNDGITTALGCPINSFLLQNNKPLFAGGGSAAIGGGNNAYAVPAGLVCMTETICRPPAVYAEAPEEEEEEDEDIIPDGLYERLMELAETKPSKKMTKRNNKKEHHAKKPKRKTHKKNQK